MLFRLVSTLLLAQTTSAFFFGGGGGGCGCQQAPACAPHPAPAPCSGGNIVQGYVGAPQQGGYAAAPQYPQQGGYGGAQQGFQAAPAPYQPQGGYQAGPAPVQGYQPQAQVPAGGYQAPVQPAPGPAEVAPAQVQAGGNYQDAPAQVAEVATAQESAPPPSEAAYTGEQEVVASLAREEPNYQNTGTNVIEAAQHASELGNQAAAAAAKVAEVVEEEEEPIKKKDEGKTTHMKTVKAPAAASSTTAAAASTSTEFPVGEEIVADTNEKEVDISELHLTDDPLCNSDDLRKVVIDNIDDQLNSSKRMIQLAAEAQFGGRFDVICANGDFSYVTNTELYCQETKGDISCYTYRQL
ncbi:Ground-like domain-containing protein [Caenorhabditis elegans]|uniref:Ground-like domain-containing protein n=1 Tax=Caenorhabditis elegans TaxID=6239 RepID=O18015_CAEEL|nr:Ground-like domain-containing protein [Caenorhabditis elegans]CAB07652.1 Ground-like domain-containing protein [Caenorhabditis elegans]|eukprot:NP_001024093.1 GRound-Like (grd related) [Caenorhabditis elegans]